MFGFGKSENLRNFELIIEAMEERNEIRATSSSVYTLWKMFNAKYRSIQNWLKNQDNQVEWLNFLVDLAKDQLEKEMEEDLEFETEESFLRDVLVCPQCGKKNPQYYKKCWKCRQDLGLESF